MIQPLQVGFFLAVMADRVHDRRHVAESVLEFGRYALERAIVEGISDVGHGYCNWGVLEHT